MYIQMCLSKPFINICTLCMGEMSNLCICGSMCTIYTSQASKLFSASDYMIYVSKFSIPETLMSARE